MDPIIRAAALTAIPRQLRRSNATPAVSTVAAVPVAAVAPLAPASAVAPEPELFQHGPTEQELLAAAAAELARARETLAEAQARRAQWQAEHVEQQQALAASAADLAQREAALRDARAALDADILCARDEARRAGHEEGLASGMAEGRAGADAAVAKHLLQLEQIAKSAADASAALLAGHEDMLVEVAFAAICRIVGESASSRNGALAQVRAAVAQVRDANGLRVRVHPDDAPWLAERAGEQPAWTLHADPRVALGGCIVEGGHGSLDARLELQLDSLRQALLAARARRAVEPGMPGGGTA